MPEISAQANSNSNENSKLKEIIKRREFGVFIALLVVMGIFAILSENFLNYSNLISVLRQTAVLGIMAVGMTMLITSNEFDLSVGSIYALSPVFFGLLIKNYGTNIWVSLTATIALAILLGMANGLITLKMGIPSFITTLGTQMLFRGVTLMATNGWPVSGIPDNFLFSILGGDLFGISSQVYWFVLIVIVGYFILQRSKLGYKIYATGGNREAAELSGVNTLKTKLYGFIFTALTATIAGLTSFAYLGSVSPTQGTGLELEVIAASVIGGTALSGGTGSILGAFLGASIMGVVRNGLGLLGIGAYVKQALIGLIIVIAVIINVQYGNKNES